MHRDQLFQRILVFFTVCSFLIAVSNSITGGIITLNNLGQQNGNALPGEITLGTAAAQGNSATLIQGIDFTNASGNYNNSILSQSSGLTSTGWTQVNSVGYVFNSGFLNGNHFWVNGVQPTNGVYDVVYKINNTVGSPFSLDVAASPQGTDDDAIQLAFNAASPNNQYQAVLNIPVITPINLYSYGPHYLQTITQVETICDTVGGTFTVKVSTNTGAPVLTQSYDLTTVFTTPANIATQGTTFAGVTAYTSGMVVQSITTPIQINVASQSSGTFTGLPIIDNLVAWGASVWNDISEIGQIVSVLFGFSPGALVPPWAAAIIFGSCIATISIMIVEIAMGVDG